MKRETTYLRLWQFVIHDIKWVLLCFIVGHFHTIAQDENPKTISNERFHQFEFRHNNDFWLSTDRYYTTGSFITYRFRVKKDSLEPIKTQWHFTLRQLFYTPDDIRSNNSRRYDRPYAGLLAGSAQWTTALEDHLFSMELLMGVAGPNSGAEGFQDLFHDSGGIDTPPWTDQIANSFHTNLYFKFFQEWDLREAPWAMKLALSPTMAIGSLDIYLQSDLIWYIGKRAKLTESIAYRQLGPLKAEFFGAIKAGYRYVVHNAMLEGNAFGDSSPLVVPATENLFLMGLEGCWRKNRNDIRLAYNFSTSETPRAEDHAFITLSYARSF